MLSSNTVSVNVKRKILQRFKELGESRNRFLGNAFIVEGRKNIEHIIRNGIKPITIVSSEKNMVDFLDHIYPTNSEKDLLIKSQTETILNTGSIQYNTDKILKDKVSVLSNKIYEKKKNNQSNSNDWFERNGVFIPPSISTTFSKMDPETKNMWKNILNDIIVCNDASVERMSQLSTSPGLLAVFPLLPNIINMRRIGSQADIVSSKRTYKSMYSHPLHEPGKNNFYYMDRWDTTSIPSYSQLFDSQTKQFSWDWSQGGLILCGVADPGNVGTLIRSAAAFNIKQVLILDGVDVFNVKTVQSTSGALADVNIVTSNGADFCEYIKLCLNQNKNPDNLISEEVTTNNSDNTTDNTNTKPESDHIDYQNINDIDENDNIKNMLDKLRGHEPYLCSLVATGGYDIMKIPQSAEELQLRTMLYEEQLDVELDQSVTSYLSKNGRKPWLIVGSEAHGLPPQIEDLSHIPVTVSMPGMSRDSPRDDHSIVKHDTGVGSLNASVAGSTALYVLKNRMGQ